MKTQVTVFWIVTPYSDVAGYQRFRGSLLPPSSGWRWRQQGYIFIAWCLVKLTDNFTFWSFNAPMKIGQDSFSGEYEGVSKSFRTGRLERELQMVHLSATKCSCIAILWVSLVSFAAMTLCVASQRVLVVVVYFVMTQFGNFWIHPRLNSGHRKSNAACTRCKELYSQSLTCNDRQPWRFRRRW
jgi:hypothetical protein